MRLWHACVKKRKDGDFQLSARDLTAVWGANPDRDTPARSDLVSLGPRALPASVPATLPPFLPSPEPCKGSSVCKANPNFMFLCILGIEFRYTVPKVRQLSWGAALQFNSVYTVPQECYLHESWKPQHLLLFDSKSSTAHETIKRLAAKENYFKSASLSPFKVENVAH